MNKKVRLVIAVGIIIGVMSFLISAGFKSSTGNYLTLEEATEAQTQGETKGGRFIQMEGTLAANTANFDQEEIKLTFGLTDGKNVIDITYFGVKPDNFDSGYPIIVEGKFTSDNEFVAEKVLVKCPSKYEEE